MADPINYYLPGINDDCFKFIPVPTLGINLQGIIIFINEAAVTDFGIDNRDLIGKSFSTLFKDGSADHSALKSLTEGEQFKDKEFSVVLNNEQKWVLITSALVNDNKNGNEIKTYLFIREITKYRKRENLFLYLNKAATLLAKTRGSDEALKRIAEFIVPSFANWFTVDTIKDGALDLVLLKHEDPGKIEWAYEYRKKYPADLKGSTGAASVVKTGQPGFVPLVTEEMINLTVTDPNQREEVKKIGLHSVIMAPIWTNEQITGLVNFISSNPNRHFDKEDLEFALNFAGLIGLALQNTRLNEAALDEIEIRKQSERKFKFLLDAIPHKMWTSGADGRATYYNEQWHTYTAISGFDNLRDKIWGHIHPDDVAEAAKLWPAAVKNGLDMEMEQRLLRYDGVYRWHLSRFKAFKDKQAKVNFWVGTSTDIDDLKRYEMELAAANEEITASNEELIAANEELEASNEEQASTNEELVEVQNNLITAIQDVRQNQLRFQIFLDTIPQIAWAGTATGEVEYYNKRWYEYTGLSFEETENWGWKQVIHPDDLAYNLEKLSAIIQSQNTGEFELREKDIDGNYRWHLVRMSPLFDENGKLEQWIGTATDIDDLKKLQQQKDDFISIASHELKTPMTTLKAAIQLLYQMKGKPDVLKFQKLIEQANRSMFKMSTLVNDLLDVNRLKESKIPLRKKWFILSELVNACCNHIVIGGKNELVILGDKTVQVYADEPAIDQVIVNFVNNSIKYAQSTNAIQVIIENKQDVVKLSVKDFGVGIAPDQLPFVFDRYYQGKKPNYTDPGLGLGLYISSEIIKRHDGHIGVESKIGQGCTFWFTLPK